jgi:glycerophosphoryl diester phosphodiesterase
VSYPRIIAHRCGGALAPENTLAGLHIAKRLGCRGVEFDVMQTADGVPVLIHDETLERTTSGSGKVMETTAGQFALLDAGGKHHRAFAHTPPSTLRQALQVCAELDLWANVEIKPATGIEAETGAAVATACAGAHCAIVLSSFSLPALQAAAQAAPQLPRAVLVKTIPADWRQRMAEFDALALHVAARQLDENRDMFVEVCRSGTLVACYTVNDRGTAERLFAEGVRAIFSDRIDLWPGDEM